MNFAELVTSNGLFCDGDWIEKKDQDPNGAVRLIQLADIGVCEFKDKSNRFITEAKAEELHCTYLQKGDILIARLPDPLGRACIFPLDGKYITAVDIAIVRIARDDVNPKYVMYMLNSPRFRNEIKQYESGTTRKRISRKNLDKIEFEIPSLSEQNCIVARIEELFSELDNGVETLRKTKQQLAVYRQAVLRDAFAGLDTFVSLQSISERIFDGPFGSNLKTSDYTSSGIRVVRLENLKDGWFDDSKQSFVTPEKYDAISSHTVYPTDLIMSTFIADSIKVCQMPEYVGFAVNKADCIGIRLKSNYVQRYVMYFLMTKNAYNSLVHEVHGATRPRVNTKQIRGIQIPVCDLSAQRKIVVNIESRLSVCDSIEKTVDTALQQAEAMRQSILKQAFEGSL